MRRFLVIVPLGVVLAGAAAHAQGDTVQTRSLEWSLGVSRGSLPADQVAPISGTLVTLALRWERSVVHTERFDVRYAPELIPFASLRGAVAAVVQPASQICPANVICSIGGATVTRTDASGIGVSPIGVRAEWRVLDGVALVATTRTSILLLDHAAPFFNFGQPAYLLDGSIGLRVRVGAHRAVTVEWVRSTLANGAFVLDDRGMKASGVRVGLATTTAAAWPRVSHDSAGDLAEGWMVSAAVGNFSPLRGFSTDAQLTTVAWRWERVIAGSGALALAAGVEVTPLVLARAEKLELPARARCTSGPCPVVDSYATPVVGFGVAPIALRVRAQASPRVQLWADGVAGGVAFDRPYPVREANQLNFLLTGGAGVTVALAGKRALLLGYRLQHLSNGFTADRNPGVNFHALTVALQVAQ